MVSGGCYRPSLQRGDVDGKKSKSDSGDSCFYSIDSRILCDKHSANLFHCGSEDHHVFRFGLGIWRDTGL